jgi:lysophospholipase L1-like esterase
VLTAGASTLALSLLAAPAVAGGVELEEATGTTYVALGDSFSSGTGTRASTGDCYRSPYGYPALLAARHGLSLDYQACSGATTADVHANQLAALTTDTDYVTMTIGGNDLDFAGVITQCALPGWLSNCDGRINSSLNLLRTTMPSRYDTLFAQVGTRAPNADVVVGSYPRLFNGRDCNLATFFSSSEMSRLNAATDELAGTIAQRTQAAGFRYVDPRPAFVGHAVCDSTEWVNGLSNPIVESYHPNRAGNVGYADVFWPGAAATASGSDLTSSGADLTSSGATGATSTKETAAATATDIVADDQHAHEVREQADAVLAMDLTSRANLAAARAEGVNTGELVRLVGQLRSGSTQVVEQALADLARMDRAHEARRVHEEPVSRQAGS